MYLSKEYITKHAELGSNGPKAAAQRKSRMKKLKRVGMEMAASATGGKFKTSVDGEVSYSHLCGVVWYMIHGAVVEIFFLNHKPSRCGILI